MDGVADPSIHCRAYRLCYVQRRQARSSETHPVVFNALADGWLHALDHLSSMLGSKQPDAAADCFSDTHFAIFQKIHTACHNMLPIYEVSLGL